MPATAEKKGDEFTFILTVTPIINYSFYKIERPYSKFKAFYKSIHAHLLQAFTSTSSAGGMVNIFPIVKSGGMFSSSSEVTESAINERMLKLDLWLREICADMRFITNVAAFSMLSEFLELDKHVANNYEQPLI